MYVCNFCGKEFDNIHALAGHIRMSHPKRKRSRRKVRRSDALRAQQAQGRLSIYYAIQNSASLEKSILKLYDARIAAELMERWVLLYRNKRIAEIKRRDCEKILDAIDSVLKILDPDQKFKEKWRERKRSLLEQILFSRR